MQDYLLVIKGSNPVVYRDMVTNPNLNMEEFFNRGILIGYFSKYGFYQSTSEHAIGISECFENKRIIVTIGNWPRSILQNMDVQLVDIEAFFGLVGVIRYSLPPNLASLDMEELTLLLTKCSRYIDIIRSGNIIVRPPIEITPLDLQIELNEKRAALVTKKPSVRDILRSVGNDVYLSLDYILDHSSEKSEEIFNILGNSSLEIYGDVVVPRIGARPETDLESVKMEPILTIVKYTNPMTSFSAQILEVVFHLGCDENDAKKYIMRAWDIIFSKN